MILALRPLRALRETVFRLPEDRYEGKAENHEQRVANGSSAFLLNL